MKRKRKHLHDVPQAPQAETHAAALSRAGVPASMQAAVGYAQVTYLVIALLQQAGGRVVLPAGWLERAGLGVPAESPDCPVALGHWMKEEDGGGYEVYVSSLAEAMPDPRRN